MYKGNLRILALGTVCFHGVKGRTHLKARVQPCASIYQLVYFKQVMPRGISRASSTSMSNTALDGTRVTKRWHGSQMVHRVEPIPSKGGITSKAGPDQG